MIRRICLFSFLAFFAAVAIADVTKLFPLQHLERKLAIGEIHTYQIHVPAGEYVEIVVEQRGIDAVVSVTGPNAKKIVDMDNMLGSEGPERVGIVGEVNGTYTVEVQGAAMEIPSAFYQLNVGKLRKSDSSDQKRLLANEKLAEGVRLYTQGDAESLKKAGLSYSEALQIWRELQDPVGQALVLHGLALISDFTGDREKGLSLYKEALPMWRVSDRPTIEALLLHNIGFDYFRLGEIQKALQYLNESLECARKAKDPHNEAHAHHSLGMFYLDAGDYQKAIEHHNQALKLRRANNILSEEADSLYELGIIYNTIGDSQSALNYYLKVVPLDLESGDKRDQAATLDAIGSIYQYSGNLSNALNYYQKSLLLRRATKDREGEAATLLHLGQIHSEQGKTKSALQFYLDSLKIAKEIKQPADEVNALIELAQLSLDTKDILKAAEWINQAADLTKKIENPENEWRTRLVRARVLRAKNENKKALEDLKEAVQIINSLRARVHTDSTKIGFLDRHQEVFHELADLQFQNAEFSESLETAEAARSRALIDLLAARQITAKPADSQSIAEIRRLESRLRAQAKITTTENNQKKVITEKDYRNRLNVLREQRNELASLMFAEPSSLSQIQQTVRRLKATVVEYLVTKTTVYIWVIQPSGEIKTQSVSVDRKRLQQMVSDLHDKLDNADIDDLRNPLTINPPLKELYEYTLQPVAADLPQDPDSLVYIIPHDVLFLVPFAALVDSSNQFVIENHTIVSAPSISVLSYTAKKKQLAVSADKPYLLAIVDPLLPEGTDMDRLPGARIEAKEIRQFFSPDRVSVLEGEKATEANVRRLSAAQTVLHFAVHGVIHNDQPWESALLLSEGDGEDGHLKVNEIFGLDLHSDLIVLSGCSTGLGKFSGDGIIGLSRAFIYAGTPSLIVSQWDVSDKATAFFMEKFYRSMHNGLNKAAALRAAKLESYHEFKHPTLWAAFDLIGEAQ